MGNSILGPDYAEYVASKFADFIDFDHQPEDTLDRWLTNWLQSGDAVEVTAGDFEVYLRAVILIISRWVADPTSLPDGERLTGVYNPDMNFEPAFMDRYFYRKQFQQYLRTGQPPL